MEGILFLAGLFNIFSLLLILTLWGLSAYVAATIAESKGRSFGGWLWAGVFYGPIGVFLVAFLPPDTKMVEYEAVKAKTMKKCPSCDELVRFQATKCKHCGTDVKDVNTDADVVSQENFSKAAGEIQNVRSAMNGKKSFTQKCKRCGTVYDYNVKICPECSI